MLTLGRSPLWVKLRRTQYEHMFSASLSNSDIARGTRLVSKVPGADISGTSVVGFGSKANREHALTAGRDRALVISRARWLVRWLGSTCQGADQARSSAYDPARESHLRTPSRCRVAKYWVLQRQIELDRHRGGLM